MNFDDVKVRVNQVLEDNGVIMDDIESSDSEITMDSLTFMSVMINLENEFEISIPEDYLLKEFHTIHDFYELVWHVVESK